MTRMHNPAHPGEVLKTLYMDECGISVNRMAKILGYSDRKRISRLINGHASVNVDIACRLAAAFNTTPDLWLNMQTGYDLANAKVDTSMVQRVELPQ